MPYQLRPVIVSIRKLKDRIFIKAQMGAFAFMAAMLTVIITVCVYILYAQGDRVVAP